MNLPGNHKDGTIWLQQSTPEHIKEWKFPLNVVGKCIMEVTDSCFMHCGIWLDNIQWHWTAWDEPQPDGKVKFRHGLTCKPHGYQTWLEPYYDLTEQQKAIMRGYLQVKQGKFNRYNFELLVALGLVIPTYPLWHGTKWVPFSGEMFGKACAYGASEIMAMAGLNITTRVDAAESPGNIYREAHKTGLFIRKGEKDWYRE